MKLSIRGKFHALKGALREYLTILPTVVWIVLFLLIPMGMVTLTSFYTFKAELASILPIFTLDNYLKIFTTPAFLGILLYTIRLGLTLSVLCFIVGYPVAYFLWKVIKREELKTAMFLFLLLPFIIDPTVRAIGWYPVLGRYGIINQFLMGIGLLKEPSGLFLHTEFSIILVMIQSYVLFMIGPVFLSLAKVDRAHLEAAETLGASKLKTFFHITFKMSLPGIIIGSVFVFVFTMADFSTPSLVGGTVGAQTMGLSIYYQMGVLNWPLATAFSTILIITTFVVVYLMLKVVDIKRMMF